MGKELEESHQMQEWFKQQAVKISREVVGRFGHRQRQYPPCVRCRYTHLRWHTLPHHTVSRSVLLFRCIPYAKDQLEHH